MARKKFKSHQQASIAFAEQQELVAKLTRVNQAMLAVMRDSYREKRAPTAEEIESCMIEDFSGFGTDGATTG